ncbi:MAG TPA: MFS transporter [Anaerolineales bacterium]
MKRMRWYDHLSVNLFWLGLNIRNTAVGSVFMPYLVDVFVRPEIKNTALGAMRTLGLLVAMLVQPAAGLLSDRSTSRFGRRRPYIFAGVVLDLVFLTAIALAGSYWALFTAVLFLQVSSNISHGPLQALIPDLVPEDQRGRSSAVKAVLELLPLVLVAFTIAKLVAAQQVGWAVAVTGAALLATMLMTLLAVKEEPLIEKPSEPLGPPMLRVLGMLAGIVAGAATGLAAGTIVGGLTWLAARPLAGEAAARVIGLGLGGIVAMAAAVVAGVWAGALGTLGQDARRNASFTWWIANRLLFLAAVTSIQGFAPYFLMSAFSISREAAIEMTANLFMVVGILTLVTAIPSGWIADRIGSRRLVGLSGIIAAAGTLVLLSTTLVPNLNTIYIAGGIIGLGSGLFVTTNWALGTQLAPRAQAGRYLGISNLAGAGAGMIGSGLGGPVADLVNQSRPGWGYFVIFACYGLLFVLSTFSLAGVRAGASAAGPLAPLAPLIEAD